MTITMIILAGLITANIILFYFITPKVIMILRNIQKLKVDINNPYLPDYAILRDQPIRFPITDKKNLYLRPMRIVDYTNFVAKMTLFFNTFGRLFDGTNVDVPMSEVGNEEINKMLGIFNNLPVRTQFLEIIKETILRDPIMNSDKVKWKELIKIDISTLVQLFVVVYDRNITSVKSFISSLVTQLAGAAEKQRAGLGMWSLQDTQWMMSQISQSLGQDLSSHEKQNNQQEKPTQLIEI